MIDSNSSAPGPFDTEEGKIIVAALTEYAARTVGRERAVAERLAVTLPVTHDVAPTLQASLTGLLGAVPPHVLKKWPNITKMARSAIAAATGAA